MRVDGDIGPGPGLGGLFRQFRKLVHLLQMQRSGGRGLAGHDPHPVPAEQIARRRDQTLAGLQRRLQDLGRSGIRNKPHLRQPSRQNIGTIDMKRKGVRAVGQGLRIVPGRQQMPAAFAHSGQSHPQIVTKRCAKGKLVAHGDRDLVQDRPAPGAAAFHQPPQCGHFSGKRTGLTLCLGPCDAGGGFDRLGLGAGGLGGGQRVLDGFGAPGGRFLRLFRNGKCVFGCGAGLGRAVGTGLCVGGGAFGTGQHGAQIRHQPFRRLMLRRQPGGLVGQFRQPRLDLAQRLGSLVGSMGGSVQAVVMALGGLLQRGFLGGQPFDHLARIAVQRFFPVDVMGKLGDARLQANDGLRGTRIGIIQGLAFNQDARQDGCGDLFFLAQRGQGRVRRLSPRRRLTRCRLGGARIADRRCQRLGCGQPRRLGLGPAAIEQRPLGQAQRRADVAVSRGGAGLPGQRHDLGGQLVQRVIDARQVRFRPVQLQFGLVAALIKPADPRRLLQDPAAGPGLGADQLADLALPHQGRAVRPGRGIGEQHLHVARPHVLAADLVGRPRVAGDPAHDVELVIVVETRRGQAVAVVHRQHDLGMGAGRTAGGAGKDHVLHPLATHGGGAVLAHDPAQCLEQVRLAAAVRADHAGQPLADDQVGRVHEAFEAVQSQTVEAQAVVPFCSSADCRMTGVRVNLSALYLAQGNTLSTRSA